MTNIVGGNAGNLSQPNTLQEGPGKSKYRYWLRFFKLISTIHAGQKSLNTHSDKAVNKEVFTLIKFSFVNWITNSDVNKFELDGNIATMTFQIS